MPPWLASYPSNVPPLLPELPYRSLAHLLEDAFRAYRERNALLFKGTKISYGQCLKHD